MTRAANHEREDALMWARIFIKREDLLKEDGKIEQGYLADLYNDINKFEFDAEILKATEDRFEAVLLAAQALYTPAPKTPHA